MRKRILFGALAMLALLATTGPAHAALADMHDTIDDIATQDAPAALSSLDALEHSVVDVAPASVPYEGVGIKRLASTGAPTLPVLSFDATSAAIGMRGSADFRCTGGRETDPALTRKRLDTLPKPRLSFAPHRHTSKKHGRYHSGPHLRALHVAT